MSYRFFLALGAGAWLWVASSGVPAQAATLSLSPANRTVTVGTPFSVSLVLDTEGEAVNAVDVRVSFPANRLQILGSTAEPSIIWLWAVMPTFDNRLGRIELQGGVPGGITVNGGRIVTLQLQARTPGEARLDYRTGSRVLRHDGKGSNVLRKTTGATVLVEPSIPASPVVWSPTHPDPGQWYGAADALLAWERPADAAAFSYVLDRAPQTLPDDVAEGSQTSVQYDALADGRWYFHSKAQQSGRWSATAHLAFNVDASPPEPFVLDVRPGLRTGERQPVLQFATTDALSGLDHYAVSIARDGTRSADGDGGVPRTAFVRVSSPYRPPPLASGSYHMVVRAYDRANNYREVSSPLVILGPALAIDRQAVTAKPAWFTPAGWLVAALVGILTGLVIGVRRRRGATPPPAPNH